MQSSYTYTQYLLQNLYYKYHYLSSLIHTRLGYLHLLCYIGYLLSFRMGHYQLTLLSQSLHKPVRYISEHCFPNRLCCSWSCAVLRQRLFQIYRSMFLYPHLDLFFLLHQTNKAKKHLLLVPLAYNLLPAQSRFLQCMQIYFHLLLWLRFSKYVHQYLMCLWPKH